MTLLWWLVRDLIGGLRRRRVSWEDKMNATYLIPGTPAYENIIKELRRGR